MIRLFAFASVVLSAMVVQGAIQMETVSYKVGDTNLQGMLVYDDATTDKRPGVVVFPEWWGLTDHPKLRAQTLAKMGYVAFAADLYGDAKTTDDPKEAGKLAGALYKDRALLRERANAALEQLRGNKLVDPTKIAAIGFCFGGSTALELARGGADIAGVVVFHGGLAAEDPKKTKDIKPKILVCTGADDPMVTLDQVKGFIDEMKGAGANYQIDIYAGAQHAFTNPAADAHNIPGIKYNKQADERSWQDMKDFFAEIFRQTLTGGRGNLYAMTDEDWMKRAIEKAGEGIAAGQAPFGACIVKNGELISTAYSQVHLDEDVTAHCEIVAIRAASKALGSVDLTGCTLYATCEPCPMCFAACHWANLSRIVYAAGIGDAKLAGFHELTISNSELKKLGGSGMEIVPGILRGEATELFTQWHAAGGLGKY